MRYHQQLGLSLVVLFSFCEFNHAFNIDGGWSPWSVLEHPCHQKGNDQILVVCGGGVQKRIRTCTNPKQEGTGRECVGETEIFTSCNMHSCQLPGEFLWSTWTPCSKLCGVGTRSRHAMCGTIRKKAIDSQGEVISTNNATGSDYTEVNYELEYEETCISNQALEQKETCNTWDKEHCPSPCQTAKCMTFAKCVDTSDEEKPSFVCECQLGLVTKDDSSACIHPPPTTPPPRPDPTLPPDQKQAVTIMTRSASTLLIIFVGTTLGLFIIFGIFGSSRVIHMNMEIALLLAHICLLPTIHGQPDKVEPCRVLSILVNYFYLTCFMFMFLESVHLYSLVAWVVHKDGLLTRVQNVLIGWGCPFIIILFCLCFEYDNFGGNYHCFLRLDTGLLYGVFIPMIVLVVITFAIVEAAGAGDEYARLDGQSEEQRTTARIMQRTLLFIMPMVFASYILGALAEYEQNIYLYSIFTLINGVLGGIIFFFHCSANETVRAVLGKARRKLCPGKEK